MLCQTLNQWSSKRTTTNELNKLNGPATGPARSPLAVVSLDLKPVLVRDLGANRSLVVPRDPNQRGLEFDVSWVWTTETKERIAPHEKNMEECDNFSDCGVRT